MRRQQAHLPVCSSQGGLPTTEPRCWLPGALVLGWLLLSLPLATSARADLVYSTFGPGDSFDKIGGQGVFAPSTVGGPNGRDVGVSFIPQYSYLLTSIELGLNHGGGDPNLPIELRADALGSPGTLIESYTVVLNGPIGVILTATSSLNPVLTAGVTYWLVTNVENNTWGGWNLSYGHPDGFVSSVDGGATWSPNAGSTPAFRVNGSLVTAVPELSSLAMASAGLAVMAAGSRLLRRNVRRPR